MATIKHKNKKDSYGLTIAFPEDLWEWIKWHSSASNLPKGTIVKQYLYERMKGKKNGVR